MQWGGANCVIDLSAEAKRPTRDIPLVMTISTLVVAVLYGIIAFVAAGVFPVSHVAGENLSLVANEILPRTLYIFFMLCGAGFALISTLNSQFAWAPKPTMQACDDGWLPSGLAKLSKWNTPIIILTILYVLGVICIMTGLSVSILGSMCLVASGVMTLLINAFVFRMPKVVPEEWEASKFKVGRGALLAITVLGSMASILSVYLNATTLSKPLLAVNVVVIVGAFIFATIREKHAHIDISYEKA